MPLLGKKIVSQVKSLTDVDPSEVIFTIKHTGEQFRSEEEYKKRYDHYCERVWTCQCTGHINLTHEEALNSEIAVQKTLKSQFPECFEKTVLELVHHSTLSLDTLVDQSWLKIQQCLSLDESVSLKIKSTDKCVQGKIVKIDTNGVEDNPITNCSSPSSDKENSTESSDSPKKWVPPKLLPYKYSIKIDEEDKVISSIPAADLTRRDKAPSKELLRLFIRSNALRVGPTPASPWVVNEAQVNKYKLPSKFADLFLSPAKMSEKSKKSSKDSSSKKKKSLCKSNEKSKNRTNSVKSLQKDNKKTLSKSAKDRELIEIYSESSDDEALINLMPLSVLKESSPKKDPSTPRKRGRPRKDAAASSPSKSQNNTPRKRKSSPPKKEDTSNKRVSPRKRKKVDKNFKQMTLFDLKGQKTPTKQTPDKRKVATPPRTPWIVTRILKAHKEGNRVSFNALTTKAAKDLTALQRSRLPEEIKDVVLSKHGKFEEKRKLKKMSPAEREAYLLKQKEEKKKKLSEKIKARNVQLKKRYEDQDLELKPLPAPKLVPMPDGLPNELFGDIAMVTEFISCYSGLLMPDGECSIHSEPLMKALASGAEGFHYVSRVFKVLLQTLLQDGIAEDYSELDTPLGNIAVTPYTASELVRLCLRKQDDEAADNDVDTRSDSSFIEEECEVPEDIIQLLETKELFELTADQKIKILKGLCLRIMGTYSVQDFMEEKQKEASSLWRRKIAQLKEKNIKKKADKKSKDVEKTEDKTENEKPPEKDLTIAHFYGKKTAAESAAESESNSDLTETMVTSDPADFDLAGVVKRRRVLAAKAAAEKVEKEKEDKVRREKEAVEIRKQRELEQFEKSFTDGIALAKLVLRQSPIGTDRNHNRYWVFNSSTPGLFVEKGWVSAEIDYNCRPSDRDDDDDSVLSSDDDDDDDDKKEKRLETTFPHHGQNLWFMYDSTDNFEKLVENLHCNGMRESALKAELKKRSSDIEKAITSAKTNVDVEQSDGNKDMLEGFRKELVDLELRLRNGGLGGVVNFAEWENKVQNATSLEVLGSCLNESQLFTMEKFLTGIFIKKEKKSSKDVKMEAADGDVTPSKVEEVPQGGALDRWRESLETCPTLSRLHVLMSIFDASIKWEKSAENAKCKICRKKGDDSMSLLCDDCNQAFHLYCLRPALPYIPEGEWFCPACRPQTMRHRPKPGTYRDMNGGSSDESNEEDEYDGSDEEYRETIVHDENCLICGGDEGLAFCSECPSAFHLDCHNPPLRHTPRSNWVCVQCKTGVRIKTKRKPVHATNKRGRRSVETSESEVSTSEEEASDAEVLPASRRRGARSLGSPSMRSVGTTTTDMEKVIIPTKYKNQQKSSRRSEPSRKTDTKKAEVSKTKADEEDPYTGYMRPSCKRGPSDLSLCEQILGCLFRNKSSWPFQSPVNKKEVPDYHTIIKKPMDFQTIKNNILCFVYSTTDQFVEDVSLVFRNAAQYNKIDSEVYTCMLDMEECFTELLRKFLPECRYERETNLNGYDNYADTSKRPKRS